MDDPTQSASAGPLPLPSADDNAIKIKRVNRACINCRKRKSRCHLDASGGIPCLRCKRENLECVLGGSNRGGSRRRKTVSGGQLPPTSPFHSPEESHTFHALGTVGTVSTWSPANLATHSAARRPITADPDRGAHERQLHSERQSESPPDDIPFPNLQNPSDALGILAQVAETSTGDGPAAHNAQGPMAAASATVTTRAPEQPTSGFPYKLVQEKKLTITQVESLLRRYHQHYHPYYPLAPPQTFDFSRLPVLAHEEPHLLTAILVISSKDIIEEPGVYEACAAYMKTLVSDLAAGGDGDIEAVEALLLLSEWAPYTQRSHSGTVGRGEEDKECWMHVGLALRIGYFLGLDKFSFRVLDEGNDPQFSRKRLIWTACYMSDRQISIRVGKAFWSRGPGPLTSLRRDDYPTLMPQSPNEEDHASIFQATLELTQLFSNVHDVLYSNPGSSFRSHLSGGYIKFIDDFRAAIYGWKSVWGTLTCSPHLKAALLMTYDYLRLYTNAFAFQATVRRALPVKDDNPSSADYQSPGRVFYNNVASVGDARFIYEGLDAAKAILTTANNFVDPEKSLRFMPLRFYLYLVYAGVFLYRARCAGVMGAEEERAIRQMIHETVNRLQRSSVGAQHLGSRYSQLLKLLWNKVGQKEKSRLPSMNRQQDMPRNTPARAMSQTAGSGTGESPAMTEPMGDFSWTDLMAVGEFAMNGNPTGYTAQDDALWAGFLPMDMGGGGNWDNTQFEAGDMGMAF